MKTRILTILIILQGMLLSAQEVNFDYLNTSLSFEERVDILLDQMTIEEKIAQMQHDAPAIPRLKVPEYGWWNEALHGVAFSGRATVFPQPIGLASSWNVDLLNKTGDAISDEARAKHHDFVREGKRNNFQGLTIWAPNINIYRDPRWGRGIETYGEDPYLTGQLGVAFIKGLQGDDEKYLKLVATPKHYAVHSGPEPDRHHFDATASDKDLYETYLPHFKLAIQEGGAYSIMSAYNRFNGESCSGHPRLLTEILREEWGFEGYVVSDCGAVHDIFFGHKIADTKAKAASIALNSGCDLNCGSFYKHLEEALELGLTTEETIDKSLKRLLLARFKLGMFDSEEDVPYAQLGIEVVNSEKNQQLAEQATLESIVLLKNEAQTLPLSEEVKHIAVLGPNADNIDVLLGNYNGRPFQAATPLEGIKARAPEGCVVEYAPGSDLAPGVYIMEDFPEGLLFTESEGKTVPGLKGEYFATWNFTGEPALTRIDKHLKFDWRDGAPTEELPVDGFSIRWTGTLKVAETAEYLIGGEGHHGYRLYIDDSLLVKENEFYHTNTKQVQAILLEAGKEHRIKIEYYAYSGDANFRLIWVPNDRELVKDALAIVDRSDVVIMCMGLSPRLEGEELGIYLDGFAGGDRTKLHLPKNQIELMKEVAKTGKPIILVLVNGSALALNWEKDNVQAIVEAWYPGQAAGEAIAKVLWGDYNPSGKLPVTFYKSVDDLPPFEDYSMKNRTYRYFEGEALYPFGYGLSYTTFEYSKLELEKSARVGGKVLVSVDVKNTGEHKGSEVVQVYLRDIDCSEARPIKELKAFGKLSLEPRESKTLVLSIDEDAFKFWSEQSKGWTLEPGDFEIMVGSSSQDIRKTATLEYR